jgi:radical SAM superfamily enzyme YgiQ (UPF0313 family)
VKLLLVNPSTLDRPYPVPPLGVCRAATAAESRAEVRVYDAAVDGGEGLTRAVEEFGPDVVGLGIRNVDDAVMGSGAFFPEALRESFVEPIREATRAPLLLGGSGYSIFPRALLDYLGADFGIPGPAEGVLPDLLETLALGGDPAAVPGVLVRGAAPHRKRRAPPTAIPPADLWRWIDYAPYRERGAYPVQTRRGCRKRCLYCTYPLIEGAPGGGLDPGRVADELERVAATLGEVTVEFVDSVFNDPPGRAEAICREIVRRGLRPRLRTMGINPAGVTPELIELMRRAGFGQIDATPDSASPAMLASLRKGFSRRRLEAAARALRQAAMPTMWFFLLGGPGETRETLHETFDFIDRFVSPDDLVSLSGGLRIYPGTPLARLAVADGLVRPGDDLLVPRFYVSPRLGEEGLQDEVDRFLAGRFNCLRASEPGPSPEMLRRAADERRATGSSEPMFRTLLRLRRLGLR